jgi:TetR/AcrR family transcriptional regulator, transcriptional repressor for nem operon
VKRGDETRARVLRTALELMWLHGYGSITVDGICEHSEIQKGSFYHFFRSKADVAAAALETYWESIHPDFERIFGENRFPRSSVSSTILITSIAANFGAAE